MPNKNKAKFTEVKPVMRLIFIDTVAILGQFDFGMVLQA